MGNLFDIGELSSSQEDIQPLLTTDKFVLERIVSSGQATPDGEWLIQEREEWVILLTGSAGVRFQGEKEERRLKPGDYLLIPAKTPHRVEWTDKKQKTVWLAIHYPG